MQKLSKKVSIGIILIACIGVGGYFYWFSKNIEKKPTNQATTQIVKEEVPAPANYKVYTDDELGFSIQYPSSWRVFPPLPQGSGKPRTLVTYTTGFASPEGSLVQTVWLRKARAVEGELLNEYIIHFFNDFQKEAYDLQKFSSSLPLDYSNVLEWEKEGLRGKKVYVNKYLPSGDLTSKELYLFFPFENSIFIFSTSLEFTVEKGGENLSTIEAREAVFNQMISTISL